MPKVFLSEVMGQQPVDGYVQILKDDSGQLNLEQVRTAQYAKQWQTNTAEVINFSFSTSAYWLRLEFQSTLAYQGHWWFEIAAANQDYIDFFVLDGDQLVQSTLTGDRRPFSSRDVAYRNFLFDIVIPSKESRQVYIRFDTHDGLHAPSPLTIWQQQSFAIANGQRNLGLGLYLGVMLVMAIYNLFIYFVIRDKAYIYYVAYVLFLVTWLSSYFGIAAQYLWPAFPQLGNQLIIVFACLWNIFMVQFIRLFLDAQKYVPWFDKVAKIGVFGLWFCVVLAIFGSYAFATKIIIVLAMAFCLPCYVAAILCLNAGFRSARYFLLAWSIMLLSLTVFALKIAGVLPAIFIVEKSVQIGSSIEVVLLSLGLADRISALKVQKQKAQQLALAAAKNANRLKDEFLAMTSHELRTPLNGIIGLAESLIDGVAGQLPQKANRNLAMLVGSGRRLANLVNDILDFSKLSDRSISLNKAPVDLHTLADVVLTLSYPLLGSKSILLVNAVERDLPAALADEERLLQILHNLVGNAIKFTESGNITVDVIEKSDKLILRVSDTGIGIAKDQFQLIFDSFEQVHSGTERAYGGTGLGLTVSKQLVELHGDKIRLESELGQGSVFSFGLAKASEQAAADDGLKQTVARLHALEDLQHEPLSQQNNLLNGHETARFHILLVDDEAVNRQVLHNHLSLQHYQLSEASSGQQALQMLAEQGPFDLVLLDAMMPGMSGYEVCNKLREQWPVNDLPVIFLTANNQVADLVQSFSVGANDYLTKPVAKHELLTRVAIHLKLLDINRTLEQKVAERSAELVEAGKMASLGTLTAGVAHEINNPTNFVHVSVQNMHVGLSEFRQFLIDLAGEDADPAVLDSFEVKFKALFSHLHTMQEGTSRIKAIVQDLRSFSQLDAADKITVNIQDGLQSTLNLVRTQYLESIDFVTEFKAVPAIACYSAQLNQVFMNLIVNACDAIGDRQRLSNSEFSPQIVVACQQVGEALEVSVRDNGCGMSEAVKQQLFEPFYTTKTVGEGTGLGLSISYGIVQKHQGELMVESKEGEGTLFRLTLPIAAADLCSG